MRAASSVFAEEDVEEEEREEISALFSSAPSSAPVTVEAACRLPRATSLFGSKDKAQ